MRTIIFFSLILLYSCNSSQFSDINFVAMSPSKANKIVSRGHVLVTHSKPDSMAAKTISHTGTELIGDFNIKMNTKNKNYFLYSAVVDYSKNEEGIRETKLHSLKTFKGCFIPLLADKPDSVFHAQHELNYSLSFDHRMNKILDNNKLYFSVKGLDLQEIDIPSGYSEPSIMPIWKNKTELFNENSPISLFRANNAAYYVNQPEKNDSASYLQIGLISYDCNQLIDFNAYFNSGGFKANVMFEDNERSNFLNWENYLKDEHNTKVQGALVK